MAKYKCQICGYVHEGDKAPEKCPVCQQPASSFIELPDENAPVAPKKKKIDTNSNAYIIIYASVMVIIVAFLLAFVSSSLKDIQDANVALDVKKQVMASMNVREFANDADAEQQYTAIVQKVDTINAEKKAIVYTCVLNKKPVYVLSVKGQGLWGPIWGYIALDETKQNVVGAYFNHEGETAGLGGEIKDSKEWQAKFQGKKVFDAEGNIVLGVKKTVTKPESEVDAVTGATLTSDGVDKMLKESFALYSDFFNEQVKTEEE